MKLVEVTGHGSAKLVVVVTTLLQEVIDITLEVEKVRFFFKALYTLAMLITHKAEQAEVQAVQAEPEEPEELVVTEEVLAKTNKTVTVVQPEQAVTLVQAVETMETTPELVDKAVLAYKVELVVLAETAVATVHPVEVVTQVLQEILEQQVTQVLTETLVMVAEVLEVLVEALVLVVQPVEQQDTTYKTVII